MKLSRLNYNHLRYFWVVAHEGNLTRAAARLALSASALSVQIQKLEAQLGHPLFDRIGRRLQLTEAGRIALDYSDTVFQAGEELIGTLRGRRATQQVLRVGALTTLSRNFQLEFLRPLIGRGDVELVVRSGTLRELLAQLESHEVDVVLANGAPRRDLHTPLRSHLLAEQPVSLVGKPRPKGKRRRPFPAVLAHEPLLLPSLDSGIRLAFDRMLERVGIRPLLIAEVDDMAMLRLLAREREGLTLVPPIVVRDELVSGILVEHYRIPDVTETFYALLPERRFPNRLLAELLAAQAWSTPSRNAS
jgi:LysR family transcriptional regulator, transcriptional activator of nhaA